VSVHCVAGLGRAPVLVAIALIEFCGMEPVDAVVYIRERRRGAINLKQFQYLEAYKPTRARPTTCDLCLLM
jgi:protein tyrosine phosphatase type 4A